MQQCLEIIDSSYLAISLPEGNTTYMDNCGLPDIYVLNHRALGINIRQIASACIATITC